MTCGDGGIQQRRRECNNPPASNGGAFCSLSDGSGFTAKEEIEDKVCSRSPPCPGNVRVNVV